MAREQAKLSFWRALVHRSHAEAAPVETTGVAEWAIVQNFYASLHMTQAYFETQPVAPPVISAHEARWRAMEQYPFTRRSNLKSSRFRNAYDRLKSVSEQVRYDAGFVTSAMHVRNSASDRDTVFSYLGHQVVAAL